MQKISLKHSSKDNLKDNPKMRSQSNAQGVSQINQVFSRFLVPFALCFCFYIQVFGELGPGGGFQAGSLFASIMIIYDLSYNSMKRSFSSEFFLKMGAVGISVYLLTGLVAMFCGESFLNYSALDSFGGSAQGARVLGITLVEIGIAIAVSSILLLIYSEIKNDD